MIVIRSALYSSSSASVKWHLVFSDESHWTSEDLNEFLKKLTEFLSDLDIQWPNKFKHPKTTTRTIKKDVELDEERYPQEDA